MDEPNLASFYFIAFYILLQCMMFDNAFVVSSRISMDFAQVVQMVKGCRDVDVTSGCFGP